MEYQNKYDSEKWMALKTRLTELLRTTAANLDGYESLTKLYPVLGTRFQSNRSTWNGETFDLKKQIQVTKIILTSINPHKHGGKFHALFKSNNELIDEDKKAHKRAMMLWRGELKGLNKDVNRRLKDYLTFLLREQEQSLPVIELDSEIIGGLTELGHTSFRKEEDNQKIVAFLRGGRPSPSVISACVKTETPQIVTEFIENGVKIVNLFGAIGDGVSTALLQTAKILADDINYKVFLINSRSELKDAKKVFEASKDHIWTPVLIIDDIENYPSLSEWVFKALRLSEKSKREPQLILILGGHLNSQSIVSKWFKDRNLVNSQIYRAVKKPLVDPSEAGLFVDKIEAYGAARANQNEEFDRDKAIELFQDGLYRSEGYYVGLWPAMYQATSGERLYDRVKRFVDAIKEESEIVYIAICAIVFVCFQKAVMLRTRGITLLDKISRGFALNYLGQLNNEMDLGYDSKHLQSAIDKAIKRFEGELLGAGVTLGKNIQFRHAELRECFFQVCFGRAMNTVMENMELQNKWDFFNPMLQILVSKNNQLAFGLLYNQMLSTLFYDTKLDSLKHRIPRPDGYLGENLVRTYLDFETFIEKDPQTRVFCLTGKLKALWIEPTRQDAISVSTNDIRTLLSLKEFYNSPQPMIDIGYILRKNPSLQNEFAKDLEWFNLYEKAIECSHPKSKRSKSNKFIFMREIAISKDNQLFDRFDTLFKDLKPFDDNFFERKRYKFLKAVLAWAWIDSHGNRNVEFYDHFSIKNNINIFSLRRIYAEIWKELYRFNIREQGGFQSRAFTEDDDSLFVVFFLKCFLRDLEKYKDMFNIEIHGEVLNAVNNVTYRKTFVSNYPMHRAELSAAT